MGRLLLCLGLLAGLAACGSDRPVASRAMVSEARYSAPGPAELTLFTSIRTAAGTGAHSALLINGSQRVIFDPAGSFEPLPDQGNVAPQRGDVIYGVTDSVLKAYRSFQSSTGYHLVAITIPVSAGVAEEALRKAEHHGWVSQAFCADATSNLLSSLPGFGTLRPTLFPRAFMLQVEKLPGVTIRTYDNGVLIPNGSARNTHGGKTDPLKDFPDGVTG